MRGADDVRHELFSQHTLKNPARQRNNGNIGRAKGGFHVSLRVDF